MMSEQRKQIAGYLREALERVEHAPERKRWQAAGAFWRIARALEMTNAELEGQEDEKLTDQLREEYLKWAAREYRQAMRTDV